MPGTAVSVAFAARGWAARTTPAEARNATTARMEIILPRRAQNVVDQPRRADPQRAGDAYRPFDVLHGLHVVGIHDFEVFQREGRIVRHLGDGTGFHDVRIFHARANLS